jgi:AcrR family transcriptional regulator
MSAKSGKRKYDAPARRAAAEATRERICAAAEDLFVRDGYARTSIRAVAQEAGVVEATIYLVFPNKAALLDAAILRAVMQGRGESMDEVVALPPSEVLPRLAASTSTLMQRAAPLMATGEGVALLDAEVRPLRDRAHAEIQAAMRAIADRLDEGGLLRPGLSPADAAKTLYTIGSETTYLRFAAGREDDPERYAAWLTATFEATLLGR